MESEDVEAMGTDIEKSKIDFLAREEIQAVQICKRKKVI